MLGPFGGDLRRSEQDGHPIGATIEALRGAAAAATAVLIGAPREPEYPTRLANVDLVTLVVEGGDDLRVRYSARFDRWTALVRRDFSRTSVSASLRALAQICQVVQELHALGHSYVDVQPANLGWRIEEREEQDQSATSTLTLLLTRERLPGEFLRARIMSGALPLAATAYLAPELLQPPASASGSSEPAAEVFGIAAVAYEILYGQPPLGQVNLSAAKAETPANPFSAALHSALAADATQRPSLHQLANALTGEASRITATVGYRGATAEQTHAAAGSVSVTPAQRNAMQADGAEMSTILVALLLVGGAFVFFGAIWLVAVNWGALGELGHFVLLALLTCGSALGGVVLERRGYRGTGLTLTILATRLLWADAAYVLDMTDALHQSGPWCFASALVALASASFLLVKRKVAFAWLSAIDVAVFAIVLGDFLSTGTKTGPAIYAALVALFFSALAVGAARLASAIRGELALPFVINAIVSAAISALVAIVLLFDNDSEVFLFGLGWPYLIALVAGGTWWVAHARSWMYKWASAFLVAAALFVVPSLQALASIDSPAYVAGAQAIGLAVLIALLQVSVRVPTSRQSLLAIVGITNIGVVASILALMKGADHYGQGAFYGSSLANFALWIGGAAILLICGYVASARAIEKSVYQLIEIAGLAQLFGVATLLSLILSDRLFYPALTLVTGALLLLIGGVARRASLVVGASTALLLNLSFQYFLRLHDILPVAVLVIGFGIALLAFGLAYERRIKRFLPLLRAWR